MVEIYILRLNPTVQRLQFQAQVLFGGVIYCGLTAFNDPHVGLVGTAKRVDRENFPLSSFRDILNYIAVMYLQRSNFDLAATSNIDGGVLTISGHVKLTA